jgi:hypothetical protein
MGPRAGLDEMEKRKYLTLLELELRPLARPASSQSLYRLSYPGSMGHGKGRRNKVTARNEEFRQKIHERKKKLAGKSTEDVIRKSSQAISLF